MEQSRVRPSHPQCVHPGTVHMIKNYWPASETIFTVKTIVSGKKKQCVSVSHNCCFNVTGYTVSILSYGIFCSVSISSKKIRAFISQFLKMPFDSEMISAWSFINPSENSITRKVSTTLHIRLSFVFCFFWVFFGFFGLFCPFFK